MRERFGGCCSHYEECSDNLGCLFKDDPDYKECAYRINLENGRIFYGKNAGKIIKVESEQSVNLTNCDNSDFDSNIPVSCSNDNASPCTKENDALDLQDNETIKTVLYIACYGNLFKVFMRNRDNFSLELNYSQFTHLKNFFEENGIPYRTELDSFSEIDGEEEVDNSPCNFRAVFELDSVEFNILNFNSLLIKEYYARQISKALSNKGVKSRVEAFGRINNSGNKDTKSSRKKVDNDSTKVVVAAPEEFNVSQDVASEVFDPIEVKEPEPVVKFEQVNSAPKTDKSVKFVQVNINDYLRSLAYQ